MKWSTSFVVLTLNRRDGVSLTADMELELYPEIGTFVSPIVIPSSKISREFSKAANGKDIMNVLKNNLGENIDFFIRKFNSELADYISTLDTVEKLDSIEINALYHHESDPGEGTERKYSYTFKSKECPEFSFDSIDSGYSFGGVTVCLTGAFEYGSKSEVEKYILERGGRVVDSVSEKTNMLVVGNKESDSPSSKTIKAAALKKETGILIVTESSFFRADIKAVEQPDSRNDTDNCIRMTMEEAKQIFKVSKCSEYPGWTLSKYTGTDIRLVIPAYIDDVPVVKLEKVCNSKSYITSLVVPDTVILIGTEAFNNSPFLAEISIPEKTIIGLSSFDNCKCLEDSNGFIVINGLLYSCRESCKKGDIVIPDGVKYIPDNIFFGESTPFAKHSKIRSVKIPEGVEKIGGYAFYGQNQLRELVFPKSLKSIGGRAFYGCSGVKKIENLSPDVQIDEFAFGACSGLMDKDGFVIINGVLFDYLGDSKNVVIPENVKEIRDKAFLNKDIESVEFASPNTKIGHREEWNACVFSGCENMADENGFVIVNGCLYNYYGPEEKIRIPDNVTSICTEAFKPRYDSERKGWVKFSVTVPESVKHFGVGSLNRSHAEFEGALPFEDYSYCSEGLVNGYLTSITEKDVPEGDKLIIPEGTKYIGAEIQRGMFSGRKFKEIVIPDGVEKIAENAFNSLINYTKRIRIPDSVEYIGGKLAVNMPKDLTVYAHKGTFAEKYAEQYGLGFKAVK